MDKQHEQADAPAQDFVVSRADAAEWDNKGLRSFFEYRDLGIATATGGAYLAHVIRATEATTQGTGTHHHTLDFQMVYVLKGWVRFIYEGQGELTFNPGDTVLQPPGIRHELTACSEDLELLEITAPAEFATHADD